MTDKKVSASRQPCDLKVTSVSYWQQHMIWELQDLVEFHEDRQRKIRMIVQPNGEIQPLDRIPMKPIRGGSGDGSKVWHLCGRCNSCVDTNTVRYNYCPFCGTKVDWDSVT